MNGSELEHYGILPKDSSSGLMLELSAREAREKRPGLHYSFTAKEQDDGTSLVYAFRSYASIDDCENLKSYLFEDMLQNPFLIDLKEMV